MTDDRIHRVNARVCPACIHRRGRVIDPDCLVCSGSGVLHLGRASTMTGPEECAYAVAIVLEAAARDLEASTAGDPAERAHLAPAIIRGTIRDLQSAGLLAGGSARGPVSPGNATTLAQAVSRVPIRPMDWTLIDAQAYAYGYGDRPLSRGMPVLSADGHPSHLARVCDPADPLTPTHEDAQRRASTRRTAAILAAAATEQKGRP